MPRLKKARSAGKEKAKAAAQARASGLATREATAEHASAIKEEDDSEAGSSSLDLTSPGSEKSANAANVTNGGEEESPKAAASATPAIDQYQRFLAQHAERKKQTAVGPGSPPHDTHEVSSKANKAMDLEFSNTPGLEVPKDLAEDSEDPEVKSMRQKLSRLKDQVASVLHKTAPLNSKRKQTGTQFQDEQPAPEASAAAVAEEPVGQSAGVVQEKRDAAQKVIYEKEKDYRTPQKPDGVNPESAATAQKNPTDRLEAAHASNQVQQEIKHLQHRINSIAGKCAPKSGASAASQAAGLGGMEMANLEQVRKDLVHQNKHLEAAVEYKSSLTHSVDPGDKFFVKLDNVLEILLREKSKEHEADTPDLSPRIRGENKAVGASVKADTRTRSWDHPKSDEKTDTGSPRASSHKLTSSPEGSEYGEGYDKESRMRELIKNRASVDQVVSTLPTSADATIEEQLLFEIGEKKELQRRIEFFFRLGYKNYDNEFKEEANDKLVQLKSEIAMCESQLQVITESRQLLANIPLLPDSPPLPAQQQPPSPGRGLREGGSSPPPPPAPDAEGGADIVVEIAGPRGAAVDAAYERMQDAVRRFSFGGMVHLLLGALVLVSGVVAPYTITAVPGLLLGMLGIVQLRFASSAHEKKEEDAKVPETPVVLWMASVLLAILLLVSALAFAYTFYTILDLQGTPACAADYRYAPLCLDPLRVDAKRAVHPETDSSGNNSSSWASMTTPVKVTQSTTAPHTMSEQGAVSDAPSSPPAPAAPAPPPSLPAPAPPPPAPPLPIPVVPTIEPDGGDFIGYVVVDIATEDGYLAISTDGSDPLCGSGGHKSSGSSLRLVESTLVSARICGQDNSEIAVTKFNVAPGPIVTVKLMLADSASDGDLDLNAMETDFGRMVDVPRWRIVNTRLEASDATRRLLALVLSMDVLANSAAAAAELAEAFKVTQLPSLRGLEILGVEVSVFDPALVVLEEEEQDLDNGTIPPHFNTSASANMSWDCTNQITTEEMSALVKGCNRANVCINDLVKTTAWLPCDGYLIVSAACTGILVLLALLLVAYNTYGIQLLQRSEFASYCSSYIVAPIL
jgi:hypothetical protein